MAPLLLLSVRAGGGEGYVSVAWWLQGRGGCRGVEVSGSSRDDMVYNSLIKTNSLQFSSIRQRVLHFVLLNTTLFAALMESPTATSVRLKSHCAMPRMLSK